MPRWLHVTLCLVLFNAIMALIWLAMRTWGTPALGAFYDWAGGAAAWTVMAAAIGIAAVVGYWPRDPLGKLRPPLPRRG